jgi:CO/xanthine dehydrogenase Mo-binding subunit
MATASAHRKHDAATVNDPRWARIVARDRSVGGELSYSAATAADLDVAPERANGLNVETVGPIALLPHGQKCGIRFEADATVTIMLGMRDYGQGWASPYFASLLVARLGIPFKRIRLYYTGVHPAVRSTPRHGPHVPNGTNVGVALAEIGKLVEALCDRAIEQGRRFLASSLDVLPADIDFEASSGRFFVGGTERHVDILEIAKRARDDTRGIICRDAARDGQALWPL